MKSNFFIGIVGGFLILMAIIAFAQPSNSGLDTGNLDASAIGRLSTPESTYDFGAISMAKGPVSHLFVVRNSSTEPVLLSKVYTSCMCTKATFIKGENRFGPFGMPTHRAISSINQTLNPGEEAQIETVFDPAAHGPAGVGGIDRSVYIESQGTKVMEFRFTANVTP